jgi:hypothetical protein
MCEKPDCTVSSGGNAKAKLLAIAPAVAAIVGITVFILLLLKNKDRITVPAELYEILIYISSTPNPS